MYLLVLHEFQSIEAIEEMLEVMAILIEEIHTGHKYT